jgi:tetratricopeptide (TPR) repeat protein
MSTRGELADRLRHARALQEAGQAREAETEYRVVLAGRLRRDEHYHPDTLAAWQNLALLIAVDGRAEEAATMAGAATESYARHYGVDHPETLTIRGNLGLIRCIQGQFADAAALQSSVLIAHKKAHGTDSPITAASRQLLARTLSRTGRAAEAEDLLRANVALAKGRHRTLAARNELADLLFQQDRLIEAQAEFASVAVETRADPAVSTAIQGNAAVLFGLGRYADAETEYRRALDAFGADDPNRRLAEVSRQHLHAARGDAESAVFEIRALLDDSIRRWGADAPIARTIPVMLGDVLLMADQPAAAVAVFTDVVAEQVRACGALDGATLCSRHMLGAALIQVGRIDDAEREFLIAADRVDRPPLHSCTFATRRGLARVAAVRGQFEFAAGEHAAVVTGLTELYGAGHPSTLEARFDVADTLLRSGDVAEAEIMHRDVLAARTRVLGAHHPDTRRSAAALRT